MKRKLWKLSNEEYDKLNPPPTFVVMREDDGMVFRSVPNEDGWLYVGYIPEPKNKLEWFFYNLIHGIWMKYPIWKVILFSLDRENNFMPSIVVDKSGSPENVCICEHDVDDHEDFGCVHVDFAENGNGIGCECYGNREAAEHRVHPTGSNVAQNIEVSPVGNPASNGNSKSVASG